MLMLIGAIASLCDYMGTFPLLLLLVGGVFAFISKKPVPANDVQENAG